MTGSRISVRVGAPLIDKHPEMLNALMNAYVGASTDAADWFSSEFRRQENIRAGLT